jgi:hypothetical protein
LSLDSGTIQEKPAGETAWNQPVAGLLEQAIHAAPRTVSRLM